MIQHGPKTIPRYYDTLSMLADKRFKPGHNWATTILDMEELPLIKVVS